MELAILIATYLIVETSLDINVACKEMKLFYLRLINNSLNNNMSIKSKKADYLRT